ncbi:hypothetical protein DORFOR_02442 [Dorea formicigenerans ATCC 27755]|uniref:Uncharacterized protein n=1 Tax=Dorea formicigenerans ATCC 27755 TaxID=411461 RepID=B0G838_9FIRM|nr:hypothetical protein DORFOR_02442 [Dorea formicigenerans ATCC 27755]
MSHAFLIYLCSSAFRIHHNILCSTIHTHSGKKLFSFFKITRYCVPPHYITTKYGV